MVAVDLAAARARPALTTGITPPTATVNSATTSRPDLEPREKTTTAIRRCPQSDFLCEKGGRSLNQPVGRHDAYGVADRHIEPVKRLLQGRRFQ